MSLAAIIFDMDGVLVDSHPAHFRAWSRLLQSQGNQPKDMTIIFEGRKREEILRAFFGADLSTSMVEELGRMKDKLFQEESETVNLIPGVAKFLEELASRDIACAVATSATSSRCHNMLCQLNVLKFFASVVTGTDVPTGKTDPLIYRRAMGELRVNATKCLVVEDAPSGIRSARAAGAQCIGIQSNGNAEELSLAGALAVYRDFTAVTVDVIHGILSEQRSDCLLGKSPLNTL